ncbi:MAG: RdgB/HAM1 family non-canonical purine NTP pyrophosphatase [Rickettsiales bacterium]|jgi:XTP/dITP diphosphohydrolase|nr:RdgB/HAM1 family non-canonical purine NTP pyrophosphatase [Rickettsiales bacterium]
MFEKIVVASKNEGKIAEYRKLFAPLKIEVLPYDGPDIPETGRTFEENARIKAEAACKAAGMAALGDDSGIVVRSLGDFPGLKSQRFAEESGGYLKAFERIESMLKGKDRDAYDICVIALAVPNGKTRTFEGRVNGFVAYPPRGTNGFGYDPIFVANGMGRTFGELPQDEKIAIDHRGAAFLKLRAYLESLPKDEARKEAKEPAFTHETAGTKVSKPAAPKRPAKSAEAKPADEWGEVAQDVRRLKPRVRGVKAKAEAADKVEKIEKAEEFEIEVEAAQVQKMDD